MDLTDIRMRLTLWGRLSRYSGKGYPTMAATEKARIGRGGASDGPYLPPDIQVLDAVVSRLPPQHKLVLVECYTKDGHWTDHATRLRLSVDSYFRRKKTAETFLKTSLTAQMDSLCYARAD